MVGNKVCCAVPWDENPEKVEAWAQVSNYEVLLSVMFMRKI